MKIPDRLLHDMRRAWHVNMPFLPAAWSSPDFLELHAAYRAFTGKKWETFDCTTIPRSFYALSYILPEGAEVSCFYLAAYMKCLFCIDPDDREFLVETIEAFLGDVLHDPNRLGLSDQQCRVIDMFFDATSDVVVWNDYKNIPGRWHAMMKQEGLVT